MDTCAEETPAVSIAAGRSNDWVYHVMSLLDAAMHQLYREEKTAHGTILKAALLLRRQVDPPAPREAPDRIRRLPSWQARRLREYIDSHISGPVAVADLSALVQRSDAHFSRLFRRTFGKSPHAFVIRRRVDLAAQYMLQTEAPLSDIAQRCGFADQSHLCKLFRQTTGYTPTAWRRAHRKEDDGDRNRSFRADEGAALGGSPS